MGITNSQTKTKDTVAVSEDKSNKVDLSFFGNQRKTPFQVEKPLSDRGSQLSISTISNVPYSSDSDFSNRSISSDLSDSSFEPRLWEAPTPRATPTPPATPTPTATPTPPATPTSEYVIFRIPEIPTCDSIQDKHRVLVKRRERSGEKNLISLYNYYCNRYDTVIIHPKTLIVHDGAFILKISCIKREEEAKHSLSIYQHMSSLGLSEHFAQVYCYTKTEHFVIEVHENAGIDLQQFLYNEDKEGTLRSELQNSLLFKLRRLNFIFKQYGILYFDMKPENLLVSKCTRTGQYILKLCDLGSLACNGYTKTKTKQSGTFEWMSPELLHYHRYRYCAKNGLTKEQKAISDIRGKFRPVLELAMNSMDYSFMKVGEFMMTGKQHSAAILVNDLVEIYIGFMEEFNMQVYPSHLYRFRFRVLSSYYIIVEKYGEMSQNKDEIALELLAAMFPSEENSATKMLKNDPLYDKVFDVIPF